MSRGTDEKWGVFQEWTEDDEVVDIMLPVPPGTTKKELQCKITADSLVVSRGEKILLRAIPLAGPVDPAECTWVLQGDMLNLQLSKMWRGKKQSDQNWGHYLSKERGDFACYMNPQQVTELKKEKERKEKELEAARRERIRASEKALRENGPSEPKVVKRIANPSGATVPNRPSPQEAARRAIKKRMEEEMAGETMNLHYFVNHFAKAIQEDKSIKLSILMSVVVLVWSFLLPYLPTGVLESVRGWFPGFNFKLPFVGGSADPESAQS